MKIDASPRPLEHLAAFAIAFASGVAMTLSAAAYGRWVLHRANKAAQRIS
jgi:hypothetical protein